jgi:formate hydrogenlyase subunit 6/NADH:ubiquinone oxidoreductase subunit I
MSLPVHQLVHAPSMEHSECILCGNCVDTCAKGVIRYQFNR